MPKKKEVRIIETEGKTEVPNCRKCLWSIIQQNRKLRKKGMLMSACAAQGYTKMSLVYNTPECNMLYTPTKGE